MGTQLKYIHALECQAMTWLKLFNHLGLGGLKKLNHGIFTLFYLNSTDFLKRSVKRYNTNRLKHEQKGLSLL